MCCIEYHSFNRRHAGGHERPRNFPHCSRSPRTFLEFHLLLSELSRQSLRSWPSPGKRIQSACLPLSSTKSKSGAISYVVIHTLTLSNVRLMGSFFQNCDRSPKHRRKTPAHGHLCQSPNGMEIMMIPDRTQVLLSLIFSRYAHKVSEAECLE